MPAMTKQTGNVAVGSRNWTSPTPSGGIPAKPTGPPVTTTQLSATWRPIAATAKVAMTKKAARNLSVTLPMIHARAYPATAEPRSPNGIGRPASVVMYAEQ